MYMYIYIHMCLFIYILTFTHKVTHALSLSRAHTQGSSVWTCGRA